jgi:hypothetical protein
MQRRFVVGLRLHYGRSVIPQHQPFKLVMVEFSCRRFVFVRIHNLRIWIKALPVRGSRESEQASPWGIPASSAA